MKNRARAARKTVLRAACLLLCAAIALLGGCDAGRRPAATQNTARTRVAITAAPTLGNDPAALYTSVLTEKRVVSLILEGYIDDAIMRSILSTLKENNTPCVFFISGIDAHEHPDVVREIADAPFLIGNYGINAGKNMENNDVQTNIYQFQRGQELLNEAAGVTPTLFRCNGTEYTQEVLKASAFAGLHAGIKPNAYLNHRSFNAKEDAVLFVQRLNRGSIISIKLGQELDGNEYDGAEESMQWLAVDPPPFLSDDMEETFRATYENTVGVISWLLEALNSEGYTVLLPEALQAERLTAFDSPIELSEETLAMLDPSAYALPVTDSPLGALGTDAADGAALDGAVFVGDSIVAGLADYVAWRRETDPEYLGTAQFLTSANLGVVASGMRVTASSVHPTVDGVKMTVDKALKKLDAKTVYLMPGLSDVRNYTPEKLIDSLKLLIYEIERENPNIRICLQSIPPGVAGRYAEPANAKIFQYNLALCKFSLQHGIHFVDAAFALRDQSGDLPEDLCMDPDTYGIHLNDAGCEQWVRCVLSHMPS